jgi:hypothetical protein
MRVINRQNKERQDGQCVHNITLWRAHLTIVAMKSNNYYIFQACICIFALVIQHANRIFSEPYYINTLSPVATLALPYFSRYLTNGRF